MSEINFLTDRRRKLTKTDLQDAKYQKRSIIFLAVALVLFLIAIGSSFFLTSRLRSINQQQAAATAQITSEESIELSFLIFANKLKIIRDLYENRTNKQEAINFFSALFGDEIFLSGMDFGDNSNVLTLSLTSDNIFAFENTIGLLDSDEVKEVFSSLEKSGLRRDRDGSYNLDITVQLKKEGEV